MQEYQGRVAAEERRLATSGEEYTDDDMSLARLDAGLYTLQQVGRRQMISVYVHANPLQQLHTAEPSSVSTICEQSLMGLKLSKQASTTLCGREC